MEGLTLILGVFVFYSIAHAVTLKYLKKSFATLNTYEQSITIFACTAGVLMLLGLIFG